MFTDLAGFTSLTQADEAGALRLLKEQERLVRPVLEAHRGRKVKSMGDGLLIEFPDALDAVECAVDLQRHAHERNAREGAPPLRLRVGLHLGDVQRRGSDIFGDAVNIAARIEPLAEPGGVCLSEPVFVQVRHRVPFQVEKLGPRSLKGVREPIEVFRIVLPWTTEPGPPRGPAVPRLAVLPLTNISPDPSDGYFADGLTEELITVLSQIRGLRVISRTSVNQYRGTTKSIAQIGSELGADSVLEGSVRKAGDQLRISVQLIDSRTDEHRWAQTYDRKLENVFTIQTEVAERTAGALKVELLQSEREALQERPTSNLRAYELYLRGIEAFRRHFEASSGFESRDQEVQRYFDAAIQEDPKFGAAYSYLANHLLGVLGMYRSAKEVVPRARELVARALELNPNSPDAHTACGNLAFQADLDWVHAEAEFQQAISLNPSSSTAHFWYAFLLGILQRFEESRKQYRAAIDLDPLWILPRCNLASSFFRTGDFESLTAAFEKLTREFPESLACRMSLAWSYSLVGRTGDAVGLVEALPAATDLAARATRCDILALLGRTGEAQALLADWEGGRLGEYFPLTQIAGFYAICGAPERALAVLEQDYREGDHTLWNAYQSPEFDSIRTEPRFVALLRAMKLPTHIPRHVRAHAAGPAA